jgi:hypothetical protein
VQRGPYLPRVDVASRTALGRVSVARVDFKTLVADVSMGQVGAVFALEASRRIPHDVLGPVLFNFPEFTFDIFEKVFFTMATSQTQTLLHSKSGLIQQVVG